ncbi:hypothetical protein [Paraburkholderia sp. J8-2]|uniref:hypothetical protein n=1 Tax=Paraburkholderia sp. J8-2 TaxID=2805440 RepID=UPI002AB7BFD1|nr:hypothetical protein [Paraburkholderia sp. J8-2]
MNQFLLRPIKPLNRVTDELLEHIRAICGVRVMRVQTYVVAVQFEGAAGELISVLAGSAWETLHVGPTRIYRIQSAAKRAEVQDTDGAQLEGVLMHFACECDLPTRAHLHRYIEAFPQFGEDLIEFAVGLLLDRLDPDHDDLGSCN